MRQAIRDFAVIASTSFTINEPIYEFGSLQVPGNEGSADLRPLFPGKEYVGADMREGLGVDMLLNLHNIDLPSESAGTVFCLDTLEHVEYPHRALEEIYRILKPNGIAIISSTMDFPIHDFPYDYWRFTPQAFSSILKSFSYSFVGLAGFERFPHTVVGIGFKGTAPKLDEFTRKYKQWQKKHYYANRYSVKQIVKLLTPPIFFPVLYRTYRAIYGLKRRST